MSGRENDIAKKYAEEIEPLLFPYIGQLFPEFKYNSRADRWESPYKLDGYSEPHEVRKDKTYIENPQRKGKQKIRIKEQGGGVAPDLLELYMQRYNLEFREAVNNLAKLVGKEDILKGSSFDEKEYRERKEKQDRLKSLLSKMNDALFSPEAADVLQYLKGTDEEKGERAYSEEYIKDAPIGYIDTSMKETFNELCKLLHYYKKAGGERKVVSFQKKDKEGNTEGVRVGYTHKLAIAYIAEGEIKGFKFRTLLNKEERTAFKERLELEKFPKYDAAYIGEYDTQGYYPIQLPTGKLSAYKDRYLNFTIVEGELDTYRGIYAGIPNLVGLSEGHLTQSQLQKLKAKGARSITIMKDTEALLKEDGTSNANSIKDNKKAAAAAVELILSQGMRPYVVYLPQAEDPKQKIDLDSYLRGLEGDALKSKAEEVKQLIENAEGGIVFLYRLLEEDFRATSQNDREKKVFYNQVENLINREECDILDKKKIYSLFAEAVEITLTEEEIEKLEGVDAESESAAALQAAQNAFQAKIKEASEQCSTDVEKAQQTAKEALSAYEAASSSLEDSKELNPETEEEIEAEEGEPIGILSNYTFYAKEKEGGSYSSEQLLLPSDGITYICAPSGHGKTKLLENLAFQTLLKEKGSVLFFTLEEPRKKVRNSFLNMYINKRLSKDNNKNNTRVLKEYRTLQTEQELEELFSAYSYKDFIADRDRFYNEFIFSGRLQIIYKNGLKVERIGQLLREANRRFKGEDTAVKAVFIDYIQLLKAERDFNGEKKKVMNEVTESLMKFVGEFKIPFVITAQPNRQAVSPLEMDMSYIADAAEIERSASLIILGYNCKSSPVNSTHFNKYEPTENIPDCPPQKIEKTPEAVNFYRRTGIRLGMNEGKFYVTLAKSRDGDTNLESVLFFYGNTGLITQGKRAAEFDEEYNTSQNNSKSSARKTEAKVFTIPDPKDENEDNLPF